MSEEDLAAAAASATAVRQVTALTRWVGAGRKLTQTGQLTMADARHLVDLLETGDRIDPTVGARKFRTRSSADLPRLAVVLAWAKAAGLLRVVNGRLVPVKKNQRLLDRPVDLWTTMFTVFGELGPALCPPRWAASLLDDSFADGIAVLLGCLAEHAGAVRVDEAQERVWSALAARYYLDEATTEQLSRLRKATDLDLRRAAGELIALGALLGDSETLRLSPAAEQVLRARFGAVRPGDQIAQIKVTLLDTDPPVWRRLLVPTTMRLDRLDQVIQAAMGWTNSHLHMFIHPTGHYGPPDPDLPMIDERTASFGDLAAGEGDTFEYEYDFGDSWTHEVLLEKLIPAEPSAQYPACTDGARACPPEDCGGTPGYQGLLDALADPGHPDHHELRQWLGLEQGDTFDPEHFDPADANRRISTVVFAGTPSR
ncbi:plasmid pRiA4b ORF-3 family protein [Actinoplanes sp. DH11]|uniref:plasmid pRiA4b ORF-3 family protein n=1 Tax=Actinoplanes sp. DH11 TaxID=2857011 RepID=UPI001E41A75F|nr:plasmid pRiA4b ORF-3 family protein [Actinoplanes sp. DH11]